MLHNTAFETPETRFLRFYNDGVSGRKPIGKLSSSDRTAFKLGWKNSGRFGPNLLEIEKATQKINTTRIIV